MTVPHLRLLRFAAPGGCCHIARSRITGKEFNHIHRHDFNEVFWIESGAGSQVVSGVISTLSAGDLVFVRPEDEHGFRAGPRGLGLLNLALCPTVVADLEERYFPRGQGPWSGPVVERRRRLSPSALRRLAGQAERVAQAYGGAQERRAVDRLLLDLFDSMDADGGTGPAPDWLRQALTTLGSDRQRLLVGGAALVGMSGRSREHVARTVRKTLGTTPSALVNRLRLERAAEDLRMTDRPITTIALDAGFQNLSYFYRRFRQQYGGTPKAYRRLHQEPLGLGLGVRV